MANFHHETVDDDDTIELSVEARSGDDAVSFKKSEGSRRRQTIQIPRASQPTNFLTKNGVHYELSSSSSSRRRRRRRGGGDVAHVAASLRGHAGDLGRLAVIVVPPLADATND